jgi:hypothetical protein
MGIGNLEDVLRRFARPPAERAIGEVVSDRALSYARVYFGSSPRRHARAWDLLTALGDDSRNYYWKLLAAREVMRLFREDRPALARLIELHGEKRSAEEVLHPEDEAEPFTTPEELDAAWASGAIVPLPPDLAADGLAVDERMGELAPRLGRERSRYRGLRPAALTVLRTIGRLVRDLSGGSAPLVVTSTVRDGAYQRRLSRSNREAVRGYSLHTTGYAFDVERRYVSDAQAAAFQYVLERLQVLGVIAWLREPAAIHVTAAADGPERLERLATAIG